MGDGFCQFGDQCNYAHGKDDLKFQTLLELDNAGVTDVEIYRTRVCFTWVATGSWWVYVERSLVSFVFIFVRMISV